MGRLDGSEESCCGVGRRKGCGRTGKIKSSEEETWGVAQPGGGDGDVRRGCSSVAPQQVRRDALYCRTSSCNNESKHIESRNNREYSEKEKANSTESGRALSK